MATKDQQDEQRDVQKNVRKQKVPAMDPMELTELEKLDAKRKEAFTESEKLDAKRKEAFTELEKIHIKMNVKLQTEEIQFVLYAKRKELYAKRKELDAKRKELDAKRKEELTELEKELTELEKEYVERIKELTELEKEYLERRMMDVEMRTTFPGLEKMDVEMRKVNLERRMELTELEMEYLERRMMDVEMRKTFPELEKEYLERRMMDVEMRKTFPELKKMDVERIKKKPGLSRQDTHLWRDCLHVADKELQIKKARALLEMNILPDQAEVHLALSVFEKSSKTFISICSSISDYIRTKSSEIIEVWPAYKCDEYIANGEYKLVFVAITKTGNVGEIDNNYEIFERGQDVFSGESEKVLTEVENGKPEEEIFSKSDLSLLAKSVSENADVLMNNHRNINVVSQSAKKSINFGKEDATVYDQLCIALYVHIKGLVPIEEEPFPSQIGDFPTDVLEDGFSLFCSGPYDYHEQLKMGLAIHANVPVSGDGVLGGTLGGFISHPSVGMCALTCAHVVLSNEEMMQLKQCEQTDLLERNKEVFQPLGYDSKAFGRVLSAFYREGRHDSSGMEVALVKIDDRFPSNGSFPAALNFADAGFDERNPMVYNTGKVCPMHEIPKRVEVYKYGITTGVTRGSLKYGGSVVRTKTMDLSFDFRLHNQIEVIRIGSKTFAEHGDSGALVFFDDRQGDSVAIGIVEGGLKSGKVLVTPISEILRIIGDPYSMATFECNASISTDSGISDDVHDDDSESVMDTSS